jgi:hypothetical protein
VRKPSLLLSVAAVVLGSLVGGSCAPSGDSWQIPKVVSLEGGDSWYTLSPQYGLLFAPVKEGGPTPMLLADGDLVVVKDRQPFAYRAADGAAVAVSGDAARTMVGGKTVSVALNSDEAWAWLEKATPEELAALRSLEVDQVLTPERLALFRKVAERNPHVGLALGAVGTLRQVLPLFEPEWVSTGNERLEEADYAVLASRKGLRMLMVDADKQADLAFLPRLKDLRTLFINEWDADKTGPLPAGMANLRCVVALGAKGIENLSPFAAVGGLEALNLGMVGSIADLSGAEKLPALKALNLFGCEGVTDLAPLRSLKQLRWLGLPSKITQEQFAAILRDHPDLAILEAVACDGITDLKPVQGLRKLQALAVFTSAPVEPLYEMKNLKWLAVGAPKDVPEDQAKDRLVKLQAALPSTAVVRVAPLCLGSGWILLLAPAIGLAWWRAARRQGNRSAADPQHA